MQLVLRPGIKSLGGIRNAQLKAIRSSVGLTTESHCAFNGNGQNRQRVLFSFVGLKEGWGFLAALREGFIIRPKSMRLP